MNFKLNDVIDVINNYSMEDTTQYELDSMKVFILKNGCNFLFDDEFNIYNKNTPNKNLKLMTLADYILIKEPMLIFRLNIRNNVLNAFLSYDNEELDYLRDVTIPKLIDKINNNDNELEGEIIVNNLLIPIFDLNIDFKLNEIIKVDEGKESSKDFDDYFEPRYFKYFNLKNINFYKKLNSLNINKEEFGQVRRTVINEHIINSRYSYIKQILKYYDIEYFKQIISLEKDSIFPKILNKIDNLNEIEDKVTKINIETFINNFDFRNNFFVKYFFYELDLDKEIKRNILLMAIKKVYENKSKKYLTKNMDNVFNNILPRFTNKDDCINFIKIFDEKSILNKDVVLKYLMSFMSNIKLTLNENATDIIDSIYQHITSLINGDSENIDYKKISICGDFFEYLSAMANTDDNKKTSYDYLKGMKSDLKKHVPSLIDLKFKTLNFYGYNSDETYIQRLNEIKNGINHNEIFENNFQSLFYNHYDVFLEKYPIFLNQNKQIIKSLLYKKLNAEFVYFDKILLNEKPSINETINYMKKYLPDFDINKFGGNEIKDSVIAANIPSYFQATHELVKHNNSILFLYLLSSSVLDNDEFKNKVDFIYSFSEKNNELNLINTLDLLINYNYLYENNKVNYFCQIIFDKLMNNFSYDFILENKDIIFEKIKLINIDTFDGLLSFNKDSINNDILNDNNKEVYNNDNKKNNLLRDIAYNLLTTKKQMKVIKI